MAEVKETKLFIFLDKEDIKRMEGTIKFDGDLVRLALMGTLSLSEPKIMLQLAEVVDLMKETRNWLILLRLVRMFRFKSIKKEDLFLLMSPQVMAC